MPFMEESGAFNTMKIVVCFKYIRDDADIKVNPDKSLNLDAAGWIVSPYDFNAVEAAMQLAGAYEDSSVEVLTLGGAEVEGKKNQKSILSRGPEKMHGLEKDGASFDNYEAVQLVKQALDAMGGADIVICGDGSGDRYTQSFAVMLGSVMGVPAFNGVSSLTRDSDAILIERTALKRERYRVSVPCVVAVKSDICRARIPSMKDILSGGKKPVEMVDVSGFAADSSPIEQGGMLAPDQVDRKQVVLEHGVDDVMEFANLIKRNL